MGKVTIKTATCENPISLIGEMAGICYGSDTSDKEKNFKRGLTNIQSGHGRTMEFPQIFIELEGYSARVIRELYTHIGGAPSRLQASTRYIKYGNFDYIIPPSIAKNENYKAYYIDVMKNIQSAYKAFQELGIPKEDIANILPLGMTSTIVFRTNLRQLVDMSHQRLCSRAYWEFRQLMQDIVNALTLYSDEWATLINFHNIFLPKCEIAGFCTEHQSCGRKPKK